ncbi:hypothetical protein ACLEX4_15520 [Pseudescherichia vulneris]
MTTKQNAIDLANTARSEASNTAKRTIAAIITNWNECVKQAGFTGVFDFPTTGYTRKSQLIADLERCAAQLDDYVEPSNYMATVTVEQHAADMNAILSGSLNADHKAQINFFAVNDHAARCQLIEAAHAEALEMDEAIDKAIQYLLSISPQTNAQWSDGAFDGTFNASGKSWHIYAVMTSITLTKRAQMEAMHAEALKINDLYDCAYTRPGAIFQEAFFEVLSAIEREITIDRSHTEALAINSTFSKTQSFYREYA